MGQNALASGFGMISDEKCGPHGGMSQYLRSTELVVTKKDECDLEFGIYSHESNLCAGNLTNYERIYFGDSGGPLVIREDDQFIQIGVASATRKSDQGPTFSLFADVLYARDWVKNIMDHEKLLLVDDKG